MSYYPGGGSVYPKKNGQVKGFAKRFPSVRGGNTAHIRDRNEVQQRQFGNTRFGSAVGVGLINLGNTCFLNSIIQVLVHCEPMAQAITSSRHQHVCRVIGFCVMCALEKLFKLLRSSTYAVAPRDIVRNISEIGSDFEHGAQEDAHEFLRKFVDALQNCCGLQPPGVGPLHKPYPFALFAGVLMTHIKCTECKNVSYSESPIEDLMLEIDGVNNVVDALKHFTKLEDLKGSNAYKCESCDKKVFARKRILLKHAPKVLAIQLKRFQYNIFGSSTKVTKHISFSEELDLNPFLPQQETVKKSVKAKLFAVVVHDGNKVDEGHYFAYVKGKDNAWYCMNDQQVYQVDRREVFEAAAYMLFYNVVIMKPEAVSSLEGNRHNTKHAATIEHARGDGHHHPYHHHRNHTHSAPEKSSGLPVNGAWARPRGATVEKPLIHKIKTFIGPALPPSGISQDRSSLVSSEVRKEFSPPPEIKTFIGPEVPPLRSAANAVTVENPVMGPSAAGALSDGGTEILSLSQASVGPQISAQYTYNGYSWILKEELDTGSGTKKRGREGQALDNKGKRLKLEGSPSDIREEHNSYLLEEVIDGGSRGKKRGREEQAPDDKEDGKRLRPEGSSPAMPEEQEEHPLPMDVSSDRPWLVKDIVNDVRKQKAVLQFKLELTAGVKARLRGADLSIEQVMGIAKELGGATTVESMLSERALAKLKRKVTKKYRRELRKKSSKNDGL